MPVRTGQGLVALAPVWLRAQTFGDGHGPARRTGMSWSRVRGTSVMRGGED